ncbi:MAG: hypothetical protein WA851_21435 [Xanthobacteraceae bacterium]
MAAPGIAGFASTAFASALNHVPPARAPCSVLSAHPCHPSFCGVFHRGPCFPYFEPPLGETLRLTIVSTDNDNLNDKPEAKEGEQKSADENVENNGSEDRKLDTIRDMFAALRACWEPPPKDEARHGMEYTVRFAFKRDGEIIAPPRMTYATHDAPAGVRDKYRGAIDAALKRCTPLHFTDAMGGAVAGRPIAIRFVDERTVQTGK